MTYTRSGTATAHFKGVDHIGRTLIAPAIQGADGKLFIDHYGKVVLAILESGRLPSEVEFVFEESEKSKKANALIASREALKSYVERLFNVEQSFADQKAEYQDTKNDLKTEIAERGGIDFEAVQALVNARLDAVAALDEKAAHDADSAIYEETFGNTTKAT